ncbi:MAG: hypothetical protein ACM3IH_01660 [Sphingobacteriales bacterium]|jgi:hypothetical protein
MSAGSPFRATKAALAPLCVPTLLLVTAIFPDLAFAYRPFDGTDAAVADVGEMEVELQPAGAKSSAGQKTLIAPATVINYGFAKDWEVVFEGRAETPLPASGPTAFTDGGAFLKHVLRPGVLQDQTGPSIATEFGVLFPESVGDTRFGASVATIFSQRWDWGTAHLNIAGALTRDQHADLFTGIIFEGPYQWTVRPVAEFFYEEEFGQARTFSALIGAIWQVKDNLSFDVGFRHAIVNGTGLNEVRAGLTFGFPLRLLGGPLHK